jgi:hypothetical protein
MLAVAGSRGGILVEEATIEGKRQKVTHPVCRPPTLEVR